MIVFKRMCHMTRPITAMILFALLAACGADGMPTPPQGSAPSQAGIQISGDSRFGVTTK